MSEDDKVMELGKGRTLLKELHEQHVWERTSCWMLCVTVLTEVILFFP